MDVVGYQQSAARAYDLGHTGGRKRGVTVSDPADPYRFMLPETLPDGS